MSQRQQMGDNEGEHPTSVRPLTAAANFNRMIIRRLKRTLAANPEADITSVLPSKYSERLSQKKEVISKEKAPVPTISIPEISPNLAIHTSIEHLPEIIFPLSRTICDLLDTSSGGDELTSWKLLRSLPALVHGGEILWQHQTCADKVVVKCSSDIVVKIVPKMDDYTEFTSLQYISNNIGEVPSPKPLGLIKIGEISYMFMTLVDGVTLDKAWEDMTPSQKKSVTEQLDEILSKMRQHLLPCGASLGGTSGEGCKDSRRHTRISNTPIYNSAQFEDFQFSKPNYGGEAYIKLLRSLLSDSKSLCVFTHGDLRKENIMVRLEDNGDFKVTGLIDWEKSGFYPDYFECTKITNTMSPSETDDWYLHLPSCVSPNQHPVRWLLDCLWDDHVC